MKLLTAWVVIAAALAFTGCSGSDDASAGSGRSNSVTPSVEATTATPSLAESETCRTSLRPFLETALSIYADPNLDYTVFGSKFDQLTSSVDQAVAACSQTVAAPVREAMYQLALANAQWASCTEERCPTDPKPAIDAAQRQLNLADSLVDRSA